VCSTVCPQLLFALSYCLPSTAGCPQLLSALNCCLPSTAVCQQLLFALNEHGHQVRLGRLRGVHARQHALQCNAAGVNAQQHTSQQAQHASARPSRPPLPDIPDPHVTSCPWPPDKLLHPTRNHTTNTFYIQDGRRNARCAALSYMGGTHTAGSGNCMVRAADINVCGRAACSRRQREKRDAKSGGFWPLWIGTMA
jgi:hypothetical protein